MDNQKLLFGAIASVIITIIGYFLSLESLLIFCLIVGVISFLLRFFAHINIVDLSPLLLIAPVFYVLLAYISGTLDFNVVTKTIIFLFKLFPSVIIGNVASEILFSFGIR